jgi:DNA-directed RNA polymerase subunit RPC12/RpoP
METEFVCANCGDTLSGRLDGTHSNGATSIIVRIESCENCQKEIEKEAYERGLKEAEA